MWPSLIGFLNHGVIALFLKDGMVMIPLLVASLRSVTVVLERLHFWWRLRQRAVDETILAHTVEGKLEEAWRVASLARHPMAHVLDVHRAPSRSIGGVAYLASAESASTAALSWLRGGTHPCAVYALLSIDLLRRSHGDQRSHDRIPAKMSA